MLPSLRPLIAESMTALAFSGSPHVKLESRYDETVRLLDGAETLRWCEEWELGTDATRSDLVAEIDELSERHWQALDDIKHAVLAWDTSTGTKRHKVLRDEISEILAEAGGLF